MSRSTSARYLFVEPASAKMRCAYCLSKTVHGDRPQPGWVGRDYKPGRDILVVLQNPGAAPRSYASEREALVQRLLAQFADSPSEKTYSELADYMLADMAGDNGGMPWAKWTHPVSKLVRDRNRLAWINVVKFRTPGDQRKDDPVAVDAVNHSVANHLPEEIRVLDPAAIVSIGSEARDALDRLRVPPGVLRGHLKLQGASNNDVASLRASLALT